jgi:hypothetical protein
MPDWNTIVAEEGTAVRKLLWRLLDHRRRCYASLCMRCRRPQQVAVYFQLLCRLWLSIMAG